MDFIERYGPWAVVAGASDGVGAAIARDIGSRGVNVVLVSIDEANLADVASSVATETRTLVVDLSELSAGERLAKETADLDVGLFIYVAGTDPYMSNFLDQPLDNWHWLVRRNCVTLTETAYHFAGRFVERGQGGMSFLTSGAAWAGASHLAMYCATKGFDLLLAEALWVELRPHGVDVLAMVLGQTDTPAFARIYGDRDVGPLADPVDVATTLLDNLANGPTYPPEPSPFGSMTRRDAVEAMTAGTSRLYD